MSGIDIYEIKSALQRIKAMLDETDMLRNYAKDICTNKVLYGELLQLEDYLAGAWSKADNIIDDLKGGLYK